MVGAEEVVSQEGQPVYHCRPVLQMGRLLFDYLESPSHQFQFVLVELRSRVLGHCCALDQQGQPVGVRAHLHQLFNEGDHSVHLVVGL